MGRNRTRLQPLYDLEVNIDHYWSKVDKSGGPTACWPWSGPKHRQGYGFIGARRIDDGKTIMAVAHRVAARIKEQRAISSDEMVIHTCSNAECQNPAHLKIGDASARSQNMFANGRQSTKKRGPMTGPQKRKYRLTVEQMQYVLANKPRVVAKEFGVKVERVYGWKSALRTGYKWLKRDDDK